MYTHIYGCLYVNIQSVIPNNFVLVNHPHCKMCTIIDMKKDLNSSLLSIILNFVYQFENSDENACKQV